MKPRYRIAFVLPNLSGGGAARVASILCNQWCAQGHHVHLITFEQPNAQSAYEVSPEVTRHQIGLSVSRRTLIGFAANNFKRVLYLRKTLRRIRPTAVISFLLEANVTSTLSCVGSGLPVLISQRSHPKHDNMSWLESRIRSIIYPRASRLYVQTDDVKEWFLEKNQKLDIRIIPNPVNIPETETKKINLLSRPDGQRRRVVSLGRLEFEKGHDRLIEAFASIAEKTPNWDLFIFGEGSLRKSLQDRIVELGLADRIHLPGVTEAPNVELGRAHLYAHTARYDGFPNAMIEALAAEVCVVATDCPGASSEILGHGRYGVLVGDDDKHALAEGMLSMMSNDKRRNSYAKKARSAVKHLSPEAIAARWLEEIQGLCQGLQPTYVS